MQQNIKIVRWTLIIFALFIIEITTSTGQLLTSKASASLNLTNKPSCQLVSGKQGDTKLTLSPQIPDPVEDALTKNRGSVQFSLLCKKKQSSAASPTPCIEASQSKCGTPTPSATESATPSSTTGTPTPSTTESATPSSTTGTPTPSTTESSNPNPNPNSGPSQAISINCTPQSTQISCSLTGPSSVTIPLLGGGSLTCMYQNGQVSCNSPTGVMLPTADGPVNCGIQNGQISCTGSALIPLLSKILGMTAPSSGTVSCITQNGKLVCNAGSSPNALVTCTFQDSQSVCTGPIPSNLGLPIHATLRCVNQNSQQSPLICLAASPSAISTPIAISGSTNTIKFVFISQASQSSCELVQGGDTGDTQLTLSSDISDQLKGLLEKKDGTPKFSLNCGK